MATQRSRLRKVLRLTLRIVLGLLLFVALAVGALLLTLRTDWGREQVRSQMESILDDLFVGKVTLGKLEGDVLGDVVLRDLQIEDAGNNPALKVATLRVKYRLLPLLGKNVKLSELTVEGLEVWAKQNAAGEINLQTLMVPSEDEPSTWNVQIAKFAVLGQIEFDSHQGEDIHLGDLNLTGSLDLQAQKSTTVALQASTRWQEHDVFISAATHTTLAETETLISSLALSADEITVNGKDIRIAGADLAGQFDVVAPAKSVRKMFPESTWKADTKLSITATGATKSGQKFVDVNLEGSVGATPVVGTVAIDVAGPRVVGNVSIKDISAPDWAASAPPTDIDVSIDFNLGFDSTKQGLAAVSGDATVQATGQVDKTRLHKLRVAAKLKDSRVSLDVLANADGATELIAEAVIHQPSPETVVLHSARIRGSLPSLQTLVHEPKFTGKASFDLSANGTLLSKSGPNIAVNGLIQGERINFEKTSVQSIHVDIDAKGLPTTPQGLAHVEVRGLVDQGRAMGTVTLDAQSLPDNRIAVTLKSRPPNPQLTLDADAIITPGEVIVVELGKHQLVTHGITWNGAGGRVEVHPDKIRVQELQTTVVGGRVALDAAYFKDGKRKGDLTAWAAVSKVDLSNVDKTLKTLHIASEFDLRGVLSLNAKVVRNGQQIMADVRTDFDRVQLVKDAAPITAGFAVQLHPGLLKIDGSVSAPGVGGLTINADIAAPKQIDDPAAWQKLPRSAIRQAQIKIAPTDFVAAAKLANVISPVRGQIAGEITFDSNDTAGSVRVTNLVHKAVPGPMNAELTLRRVELGVVAADLKATITNFTDVAAAVTVSVPVRPFDFAAWKKLDRSALRGATLDVNELVLDAEKSRTLGLKQLIFGRGNLHASLDQGAQNLKLRVGVKGFRTEPLVRPIDVKLDLDYDGKKAVAVVASHLGGKPLLSSRAELSLQLSDVLRDANQAMNNAQLDAQIKVPPTRIVTLQQAMGVTNPVSGVVSFDATWRGSLQRTDAKISLLLTRVGISGKRQLRELRLDGTYDGKLVQANIIGTQEENGSLRLVAKAEPLQAAKTLSVDITAEKFDIAPLIQLAPDQLLGFGGIISAKMKLVSTDAKTQRIEGRLAVDEAHLPLHPSIGALQHANLTVNIKDNVAELKAAGTVGGGKISANGNIQLNGLVPTQGDLDVDAQNIVLISELQPRLGGKIHAQLRRQGSIWKVDVAVRPARLTLPEDKGHKLHEVSEPSDLAFIANGVPMPRDVETEEMSLQLGVRPRQPTMIVTMNIGPVSVKSKELRGEVVGELQITMDDSALAVDGTVRVSRGVVELFEKRYRLDRARIRFDGSIDPLLDIEMVHEFPQLTLYAVLRGRLSQPEIRLRSEPGTYSEGQLLSFLLGAEPDAGQGQSRETKQVASSVASSLLSKKLTSYVKDYLPVDFDVLRYETATATSGAALIIGKWLTEKLFVAYRRQLEARPDQNSGQGQLEYWLRRNVFLEGVIGDRGIHGLDLLWIRRW